MRSAGLERAAGWVPCALALLLSPLHAATGGPAPESFADLTLEQLGSIQVTSVSRRGEPLSEAAASIYVIGSEEIRRSGANTLPEALRLAPNLEVARADANQYAISARGFNAVLANKMLVMIDGRTVYSPLFSGVFWEAQDVPLEDVERIEVISGPGGALWGSNAVNGVIHVITRSASETQGGSLAGGAGAELERASARYGVALGDRSWARFHGLLTRQHHSELVTGAPVRDGSRRAQGGFRADWPGDRQGAMLQGALYTNSIEQLADRRVATGGHLLGSWTRGAAGAELRAQGYYDFTRRNQPGSIRERLHTLDLELQQRLSRGRHLLLVGMGYRHQIARMENLNPTFLAFIPADRDLRFASLFVQDEFALRDDLVLSFGAKLERNDYTGTEVMPNLRLGWKTNPDGLLWAELSRAVRAPSRVDRELYSPGTPPHLFLAGGSDFRSEVATVAELGWRTRPTTRVTYSITGYHHDYDRLRSVRPSPAGPEFANDRRGSATGIEGWGGWRPRAWWRLTAGLLLQRIRLSVRPGGVDLAGESSLRVDPAHQWRLQSSFDLGPRHELDLVARQVGALQGTNVPRYTLLDARAAWWVRSDLELSLTAANLLDEAHQEWVGGAVFERGLYAKVLWRIE